MTRADNIPVLQMTDASRTYERNGRRVLALRGVNLTLRRGEALGIVGESGSGKSTLLRHLACLERLDAGRLFICGQERTRATPRQICRDVQMVFQDPISSFDPRMTVGASLAETMRLCPDRGATVSSLAAEAGLSEELTTRFPWQLSGGQCQRFAIARALAPRPAVLLCDEVTSALDVLTQAQILRFLADLRDRRGLSILFVSHDMALVSNLCSRVMVFEDGRCIEEGPTEEVIASPRTEYARRLLSSVLSLNALN